MSTFFLCPLGCVSSDWGQSAASLETPTLLRSSNVVKGLEGGLWRTFYICKIKFGESLEHLVVHIFDKVKETHWSIPFSYHVAENLLPEELQSMNWVLWSLCTAHSNLCQCGKDYQYV